MFQDVTVHYYGWCALVSNPVHVVSIIYGDIHVPVFLHTVHVVRPTSRYIHVHVCSHHLACCTNELVAAKSGGGATSLVAILLKKP